MTSKFEPQFSVSSGKIKSMQERLTTPLWEFNKLCYATWPDLPDQSQVVVMPYDDFATLVEETAGRTMLTTRGAMAIRLLPRHAPEPTPAPLPAPAPKYKIVFDGWRVVANLLAIAFWLFMAVVMLTMAFGKH